MRILVVSGNSALCSSVTELLGKAGFSTQSSTCAAAGLDEALSGIYDAALVSSALPDFDGAELLRRLRQERSSLHVLMLTPPDSAERTACLDAGADCCLSLPFENAELLSSLRALLRRRSEVLAMVLSFGDLTLNLSSNALHCGERKIRLNSTEVELMRLLIINGENLVSKENLLLKIWGYDSDVESGIVETYISFIRKKLRRLDSQVSIETVWRGGYRLTAEPKE